MKPENQAYHSLPDFDQSSIYVELDESLIQQTHNHRACTFIQRTSYAVYLFFGSAMLFALSIGLLVFVIYRQPSEMACATRLSTYCKCYSYRKLQENALTAARRFLAPVMEAVEYEEYNFVNPFMHPSVYRGPPTNELEREWEQLWNCMFTTDLPAKTRSPR